jgi:fucose permease
MRGFLRECLLMTATCGGAIVGFVAGTPNEEMQLLLSFVGFAVGGALAFTCLGPGPEED